MLIDNLKKVTRAPTIALLALALALSATAGPGGGRDDFGFSANAPNDGKPGRAPANPSDGREDREFFNGAGAYVIGAGPGGGNASPAAIDDVYLAMADTPIVVDATSGLLANDSDPDGDGLSVLPQPLIGPNRGSLQLSPDGAMEYVPDAGFVGSDRFVYTVEDVHGATDQARVTLRIGTGPVPFEAGVVQGVSNTGWTPVSLSADYISMIVIATPVYDETAPPQICRVRNATGNGFELRVDRFDGSAAPTPGTDVHFFVIEKGVYSAAEHGIAMEAQTRLSTITDRRDSWTGSPVSGMNLYSSPVVLGQVMSYADPRPSVFWAGGSDPTDPPDGTIFFAGKHVAEDPDGSRANELFGYLIVEAGQHILGDRSIVAGVIAASVTGMDQTPPLRYETGGLLSTSGAVLGSAGMNENDGGWPVLYGADPVSASHLDLVIDEDQLLDPERAHAAEQVAFLVSGFVTDVVAPVITLLGDDPYLIEAGDTYEEPGATAYDDLDGDLTGSINIDSSAVDTAVPGNYAVTYDVSDNAGNAADQLSRTVIVADPPPVTRVMPIGDSITEGNTGYHTYRYYLSQAYPGLDMVGTRHGVVSGQEPLDGNFDQDHESYWGQRADQVAVFVDSAADLHVPDVALVHLGTNDILQTQSIESTIADLEAIVQHLRDANPAVEVFVAEIIYCNWLQYGCDVQDDLNAAIAVMVPDVSTAESPVYLVPMGDLDLSDLYDGVHPNNTGSLKMMLNWEAALQQAGVL